MIYIVALLIMLIVALLIKQMRADTVVPDEPWPFYAKKPMTNAEQVLYFRLEEALPDHLILAQVQLSRFLGVAKGNNFHAWNNRINRMSADFVVCKKDGSVQVVIELDDHSHHNEERKNADTKKNKALAAANLPMIRWQVTDMPDIATIQKAVLQGAKTEAVVALLTEPPALKN